MPANLIKSAPLLVALLRSPANSTDYTYNPNFAPTHFSGTATAFLP
jgi:hypothetical protein